MATKEQQTVSEVIDALGGTKAVADLTGRGASAISMWKHRQAFPAFTFVILKSALAVKGCSAPDTLWKMAESAETAQ
ncbi:MAG: hypothetical protein JWP25_4719 [Bradyrhizobium sp.]|nr:hypothetical protein [Bradyrhizobium sp.]